MKEEIIVIDLPSNQPMDELFAVMVKDKNGNEGICTLDGMPMVFGQMDTLKTVIEYLPNVAKKTEKAIQLCRYKKVEVMKEIK